MTQTTPQIYSKEQFKQNSGGICGIVHLKQPHFLVWSEAYSKNLRKFYDRYDFVYINPALWLAERFKDTLPVLVSFLEGKLVNLQQFLKLFPEFTVLNRDSGD